MGGIYNKSKLGYNGAAKVDSDSLNQTSDVIINNSIEAIKTQVDHIEKVFKAELTGHKRLKLIE